MLAISPSPAMTLFTIVGTCNTAKIKKRPLQSSEAAIKSVGSTIPMRRNPKNTLLPADFEELVVFLKSLESIISFSS